jgi:hypothetical protein
MLPIFSFRILLTERHAAKTDWRNMQVAAARLDFFVTLTFDVYFKASAHSRTNAGPR